MIDMTKIGNAPGDERFWRFGSMNACMRIKMVNARRNQSRTRSPGVCVIFVFHGETLSFLARQLPGQGAKIKIQFDTECKME
jgi:hypothetical protein